MVKYIGALCFVLVGCLNTKAFAAGGSGSFGNGGGRASRQTGNTIDDCLQKDSISCLQLQVSFQTTLILSTRSFELNIILRMISKA